LVTFTGTVNDDCTDLVSLRLWIDGGSGWEPVGSVIPGQTFYVNSMNTPIFDDPGGINYMIEATDAYGNVVTASGSVVAVFNVNPTLSFTSLPAGITIHDNQSVTVSGTVTDPAGSLDPLTVTINWGPGPNAIEVITIDPNGDGSFSASHAYALPSDQTVTISVTVDDDDGGSDSLSFSLTYHDVITITSAIGVGAEGGYLHFLLEANTAIGSLAFYEVDIDNDGGFDESADVTGGYDTEHVAMINVDKLALLGGAVDNGLYPARVRVTTSDGLYDEFEFNIDVGNTDPVITVLGPPTINEGDVYTITVSTSDLGPDSISSLSVD
jgi:hypothetical protein